MKEEVNVNGIGVSFEGDKVVVSGDSGLVVAGDSILFTGELEYEMVSEDIEVSSLENVTCASSYHDGVLDLLVVLGEPCGDRVLECFRAAVEEASLRAGILMKLLRSRITLVSLPGSSEYDDSCLRGAVGDVLGKVLLPGPGVEECLRMHGAGMEEMVDAGMELCVGVEVTAELRERLEAEITRALGDLNVRALLAAALHLEDDIENRRLLGLDLRDDPAFLYSDEVIGMAIANQIAGTKAIFNFKRYDEEKPGVIGGLGPMVDDAVAGLIAGCMSRIFE